MPELPEVEALARAVGERAAGLLVARVDLAAVSALKTYDPPITAVEGRTVGGTARYGKFLALDLSVPDDSMPDDPLRLVVHLSRAGWLQWRDALPAAPPKAGRGPLALRLALMTSDAEPVGGLDVTEAGTRKGLAVYVVRDPLDVPGIARLGPDPLTPAFTVELLTSILAAQRGKQLKGILRDQALIAGIGNAYSDEILHAARLSPFAPASSLTETQLAGLFDAIRKTLQDAVTRSLGHGTGTIKAEKKAGLRVHGRTGETCLVCGDVVREVSFADSSLQYCATCQTGGKPLADRRMSHFLR